MPFELQHDQIVKLFSNSLTVSVKMNSIVNVSFIEKILQVNDQHHDYC